MNKKMSDFARKEILTGLKKLPENNILFFKRMYSHKNLDLNINDVVIMPTIQANSTTVLR